MHELSIALSILDVAVEERDRHGGGCVRAIHVRLGPYSGVAAASLQSAFELAREGSPLSEAELKIEEVPLRARCGGCGAEQNLVSAEMPSCPRCGEPLLSVVQGRELEMVALEMDS